MINKRKTPRHQQWDYRWAAAYFITICTKSRYHYFGKVHQGKMQLTKTGVIADLLWHEIKNHAKNVELGEFVVMPNHVHGIIVIPCASATIEKADSLYNRNLSSPVSRKSHQFRRDSSKTIGQSRFQNIGKNSISSIIGGYKAAVTKHCNRLGFDFKWQPRFYDIIIRDAEAFDNITHYIRNNPANWAKDKFSKK